MPTEIRTLEELKQWAELQLFLRRMSQRELGRQMKVAYPRISEALNGKMPGLLFLGRIIEELGGDPELAKTVLARCQNNKAKGA